MPNPKKQHNLKRFHPSHPFHPPLINSNSNICQHDRTTKKCIQTKLEDYYVNLKQNNSSKFNSQQKYTKQSVASFQNYEDLDDVVNPYDQLDMDRGKEREGQGEVEDGIYGFQEEEMMGYLTGSQPQETYIFNDQINISSSSSQPYEYRHKQSDRNSLKKPIKRHKNPNSKQKHNKTLPNFLNSLKTKFHINIDSFEHSQQNENNIIDIPQQYLINQIPSQDYEYFIDVPDFDINLYQNSQKKENVCNMVEEYVEEISSSSDLFVEEQQSDGVSSCTVVSSSETDSDSDSDSQCKQIVTINLEQADSTQDKKYQAHEVKNAEKEIKTTKKQMKKSSKQVEKSNSNIKQQRKQSKLKPNTNIKKKQQPNHSILSLKDDQKNGQVQKAKTSFPKLFFANLFGQQNQDQPKDIEHPIFQMQNVEQMELKAEKKKRKRERKQIQLMKNTDILVPYPSPSPPQVSDPAILSFNKLLSIISFLRRPKSLQRLIRRVNSHHHSQRSELVSCLFFNNSYFENIEFNIPHAMKIPLHFRSGQDYQRIFSSHIRNQIYHQTRQKIAQLHKIAPTHLDPSSHLQKSSAQLLFNLTITREQKITRQNLYELTGQIHLQCSNYGATQRLFNQIYQNYKSKYRLLVFIGQDEQQGNKFTVVCQIRKVYWERDEDKMVVWLIGGVGVEGKKVQGGLYDLGKITTPIRDYEAIQNIKHSPLFPFLLNPASPPIPTQLETPQNPTLPILLDTISQNYNSSQQQAIKQICSASSGMHLLQGPPGTGKTHTLLGILSCQYNKLNNINTMIQKVQKIRRQNKIDIRIVNEDSQEDDQIVQTKEKDANLVKILVCTPSNAAVDYIVAKIIRQGLYGLGQSQEWLGLNKVRQQPKLNKNIIDINQPLTNYSPDNYFKNTQQKNNRIYPRFLRIGLPEPSPSLNPQANMPLPQFENLVRLPQPIAIKVLSLLHPYSFNLYQIINQLFQQEFKKKSKHVPVYCIVQKIYKLEEEIKVVKNVIDEVVAAVTSNYDLDWDIIINQLFYIIEIKKTLIKALSFFNQPSSLTSTQPTLKHIISKTEHLLVYSSDIILTTLTTSFSQKLISCNPTFSCLIVDQAAQATQPNILIPMQYGMNKVILVGDHCQLPATVRSVELKRAMFQRSLFERVWEGRAWETNVTKNTIRIVEQRDMQDAATQTKILHMLDTQYRMHPDINEFPNKIFYQNRIKSATHSTNHCLKNQLIKKSHIKRGHNMLNRTQNKQRKENNNQIIKLLFDNVCFIDCQNGIEQKVGSSYVNKLQALIISAIVKQIFTCSTRPEIGIITPYTQQQRYLKSLLPRLSHLTISTVDSYQGQERDIILISTVRSNSQQNTGFIGDEKRMNVALTRAKYALIIVGNASTLSNSAFWGLYLQWVRRRSNKGGWKQFQGGDVIGWVRKEVVGKEVIRESRSDDRLWAISNNDKQKERKKQEKIAKVLQEQQSSIIENSISIPTSYRRGRIKKQAMDEQIEVSSQQQQESY